MRFLANENVTADIVANLRARGHDVVWVAEGSPSLFDSDVLSIAVAEQRTLLTFDLDFGELAFRHALPAGPGIILLRLPGLSPGLLAERAVAAITSRQDWPGHFSVIELTRIRMTQIP